jgi:hypothetical protein
MRERVSGSRPLRLELAGGEPVAGGLDFEAALWELVSEAEWQQYRDADNRKVGFTVELLLRLPRPGPSKEEKLRRLVRAYRKAVLEKKWRDREVVCFGFPRHKQTSRRELVSPALMDDHLHFQDGGAATDTWEDEDEHDRKRGMAYAEVLFYRADSIRLIEGGDETKVAGVDARVKRDEMIDGLERAIAAGVLADNKRATLKAAHRAMFVALGYQEPPAGMGYDAFCEHCRDWLKVKKIV